MGRKTFDSVGVLPNRYTYVLTNDTEKIDVFGEGYKYVNENRLWSLGIHDDRFWVCGGAKVYKEFLPLCSEVYVTIVLDEYDGDTFLDPFEEQFSEQTLLHESETHWIVKYSKKSADFIG